MDGDLKGQFQRTTIVPLDYCSHELNPSIPFEIMTGVYLKQASGVVRKEHFELWGKYLSDRDREALTGIRFALVNTFFSEEPRGRQEQESRELLHKVFVCLRLIKPTRTTFRPIIIKNMENEGVDVLSFTVPNEWNPNLPKSEELNSFNIADFNRLRNIIEPFLSAYEKGPKSLRRAIRFYEEGYSDIKDSVVQIIIWVMGLLNALGKDETALSRERIFHAIEATIGLDADVFENSWLAGERETKPLLLGDCLTDLFLLYDRFISGSWVPPEWRERETHIPSFQETIEYPEILRGVASYLLRRAILSEIRGLPGTAGRDRAEY